MKRGFTLVELSIVLVIIGLLIGGILVAQSMISTAKVQGVVRQLSQYDAAIANFITKYNKIPGCSGISSGSGSMCTNNFYENSGYMTMTAWPDLSLGVGLMSSLGTIYVSADPIMSYTTEANCPQLNIDQATTPHPCVFIKYPSNTVPYYEYENGPAGDAPVADPFSGVTAQAIDSKMDDGLANSGNITVGSWTNGGACASGSKYVTISPSVYACTMNINIGLVSGVTRP